MDGDIPSAKNKAELRTAVLHKRDGLTPRVAEARSGAMCERLETLDQLEQFHSLAAYAPIRNEIDPADYLAHRQGQGARLYFPRVRSQVSSQPEPALDFVAVDSLDELSPGAFDVPEPAGEASPIEEIQLFFVPGAAFDRQGRRVGFGRGYYDRALARAIRSRADHEPPKSAPWLVGICYAWQLLEGQIPVEPHDVSMDMIATEEEIVFCSDRRMT
jgi:5-formyltetrahydrofolate cyclo-ligase